jgi:hypothetical protein
MKRWRPDEIKLLSDNYPNPAVPMDALVRRLGRSYHSIQQKARLLGIHRYDDHFEPEPINYPNEAILIYSPRAAHGWPRYDMLAAAWSRSDPIIFTTYPDIPMLLVNNEWLVTADRNDIDRSRHRQWDYASWLSKRYARSVAVASQISSVYPTGEQRRAIRFSEAVIFKRTHMGNTNCWVLSPDLDIEAMARMYGRRKRE